MTNFFAYGEELGEVFDDKFLCLIVLGKLTENLPPKIHHDFHSPNFKNFITLELWDRFCVNCVPPPPPPPDFGRKAFLREMGGGLYISNPPPLAAGFLYPPPSFIHPHPYKGIFRDRGGGA